MGERLIKGIAKGQFTFLGCHCKCRQNVLPSWGDSSLSCFRILEWVEKPNPVYNITMDIHYSSSVSKPLHACLSVSGFRAVSVFPCRAALSSAVPAARTSEAEREEWRRLATWWSWASPTCVWLEAMAVWLELTSSGLSGVDFCSTWSKLVRYEKSIMFYSTKYIYCLTRQ